MEPVPCQRQTMSNPIRAGRMNWKLHPNMITNKNREYATPWQHSETGKIAKATYGVYHNPKYQMQFAVAWDCCGTRRNANNMWNCIYARGVV